MVAVRRGTALWCGPVLDADSACCPVCCLDCLGGPPSTGASALTAAETRAAAGLLAGEVLHTLGRFGRNHGGTRVVRHDMRTWRSSTFDVIRRPDCPHCAPDAARPDPDAGLPDAALIRRYEAAVSLPARRWLDPAVHRVHYRPGHLAAQLGFRAVEGAPAVPLADHALDEDGLTDGPAAQWIGALLRHAVGLRRRPAPGEAPDRWAASAGNLGSTVAYCLVRDLGLPDGLYQYDPPAHRLLRLPAHPGALAPLWADIGSEGGLAVVVTADLGRLAAKYGLKSYRLAWLESGVALAQLRAAAGLLGLPVRAWQDWDDRLWQQALGTSARAETVCAGALLDLPGAPR
jgi:SagB-type dehydrogenase family enzyme